MQAVTRWTEIPEFADEAAEARYWETHELDGRLMATSVHEADSRESTTITLRFDPRMLSRIKRIAHRFTGKHQRRITLQFGLDRGERCLIGIDRELARSVRAPRIGRP